MRLLPCAAAIVQPAHGFDSKPAGSATPASGRLCPNCRITAGQVARSNRLNPSYRRMSGTTVHLDRSLQAIRAVGKRAGVAINPATPPEAVTHVLDRPDLILVMTVNPGFGGKAFIPAAAAKLPVLRTMIGDRPIRLEVDGGKAQAGMRRRCVEPAAAPGTPVVSRFVSVPRGQVACHAAKDKIPGGAHSGNRARRHRRRGGHVGRRLGHLRRSA
jgi:Ribulose-phosphate 3 epimerase family